MEHKPGVSAPGQTTSSESAGRTRRLRYRHRVSTLAYVNLDHSNGGIVRDLGEAGLGIQAVNPLRAEQRVHLRFDLSRPRLHVETIGRVAWADLRGQAGIEFPNLKERSRRLLKQWIFSQLLARAERLARMGSIFVPAGGGEDLGAGDELWFSSTPRPSIRLASPEDENTVLKSFDLADPDPASGLRWPAFSISPRNLARLVDGLIVLAAVVLFSGLALATTPVVPTWPVALSLLFAVIVLFAVTYWILAAAWMGATPGAHFARRHGRANTEEEERPRFR
jgi:hypothetical protein